jgi:ligand-binding sensor domain-containing protein
VSRFILCLFSVVFSTVPSLRAQPIGSWQEYLPYSNATDLCSSAQQIFTATPFSCFSLMSATGEIKRLSRISGLSETGVATIFCTPNGTLIIAYKNSAIDIVRNNKVTTVNALQLKPINGDKQIYQISGDDETCYLSTGFGIVLLNLLKNEIGDNWILGDNGGYLKINATLLYNGYYYAATTDGLKRIPAGAANPADYKNWQMVSGTGNLPVGDVQQMAVAGAKLFLQRDTMLYLQQNASYLPVYHNSNQWKSISGSYDKLYICERYNGAAFVQEILADGQLGEKITDPLIEYPGKAISWQNSLYIADSLNGLLEKNSVGITAIVPNSPAAVASGDLLTKDQSWWAATGRSISYFTEHNFTIYNADGQALPLETATIGPLALDKAGTLWAGTNGSGLLKKSGAVFTVVKSPLLQPAVDSALAYRVGGLAVDKDDNLWISNAGAANGLVVRLNDGTAKSFSIPFTYERNALTQVLIDDNQQKWIVSPGGNGLFCFNDGQTINNSADDQWRYYRSGKGNGNLPSNDVLCLAKDDYGFVWVGTADGIGIIQCVEQVFQGQGCDAVLPVVQTDQFAGYLFKGEEVRSIAVDGANRKWIGTNNGVWLISAGGEKTIHRFTTANSPLLSNNILKIAIDATDGNVLFSTAAGICAFKSDATAVSAERSTNVKVYPNPVPPGYNGQIAVRGLVNNAIVKITELNGRLVNQGRALGTQFVWDGHDLQGKSISTGVYLVFATDESRTAQLVTKIVFIQK